MYPWCNPLPWSIKGHRNFRGWGQTHVFHSMTCLSVFGCNQRKLTLQKHLDTADPCSTTHKGEIRNQGRYSLTAEWILKNWACINNRALSRCNKKVILVIKANNITLNKVFQLQKDTYYMFSCAKLDKPTWKFSRDRWRFESVVENRVENGWVDMVNVYHRHIRIGTSQRTPLIWTSNMLENVVCAVVISFLKIKRICLIQLFSPVRSLDFSSDMEFNYV